MSFNEIVNADYVSHSQDEVLEAGQVGVEAEVDDLQESDSASLASRISAVISESQFHAISIFLEWLPYVATTITTYHDNKV